MKVDILCYLKEEEIVGLASELIRIPSFTEKETPRAQLCMLIFL